MKVKVKNFQLREVKYAPKNNFALIQEAEIRVKQEDNLKRRKEQKAIEEKYEAEYFGLFPDDPFVCYVDDVDNTPAFDPWIMTSLYLWGIENKRHWYEWPDLPASYTPSDVPNSALKAYREVN